MTKSISELKKEEEQRSMEVNDTWAVSELKQVKLEDLHLAQYKKLTPLSDSVSIGKNIFVSLAVSVGFLLFFGHEHFAFWGSVILVVSTSRQFIIGGLQVDTICLQSSTKSAITPPCQCG